MLRAACIPRLPARNPNKIEIYLFFHDNKYILIAFYASTFYTMLFHPLKVLSFLMSITTLAGFCTFPTVARTRTSSFLSLRSKLFSKRIEKINSKKTHKPPKNMFGAKFFKKLQNQEEKENACVVEKKSSPTVASTNKFIIKSQKIAAAAAAESSISDRATLIVHDVSNMLSIMKKYCNTVCHSSPKTFDLNMENNILKIIEEKMKIENLKNTIKQRIVVGSTISNTTSKGFIFQNKIFTTPGVQNPFWGIRMCSAVMGGLTYFYPNLEHNHVYLEYKKTIFCKEEKVDYNGAKFGKENLHLIDTLILLSGDGNAKEKYGFRHLCMDAISQNKKVIVFGLNTSKFYKQLAKQNKIILIDGDGDTAEST